MITRRCSLLFNVSKILTTQLADSLHTQKLDWRRAVRNAEKVVGYPTSFLNLRSLFSDDTANFALHLRKIMSTSHPIVDAISEIVCQRKNKQDWGLVILLMSKAGGQPADVLKVERDEISGILRHQRVLAEVVEMIRMALSFHKSIDCNVKNSPDWNYANKIAILSGDYLLGHSCGKVATFRNSELSELMSSALRDLVDLEFVGPRDKDDNPLPAKPSDRKVDFDIFNQSNLDPVRVQDALGNAEAEWTARNYLNSGSLLGKSCEATLKLAKQPSDKQMEGYRFGVHLALGYQAEREVALFDGDYLDKSCLISAPVLYELEKNPSLYEVIEKSKDDVSAIDYELLYETVTKGSGVECARDLQERHCQAALNILENFPNSDARRALNDMIITM